MDLQAAKGPIERLQDYSDRTASEFAAIGVRFCFVLNAGGLIAVPAIMELIPSIAVDRKIMIWSAVLFVLGVLFAALANYLAYRSASKASEAWCNEVSARTLETYANYYQPQDEANSQMQIQQHRSKHKRFLKSAKCTINFGVWIYGFSIISFLLGVGNAILGMAFQ